MHPLHATVPVCEQPRCRPADWPVHNQDDKALACSTQSGCQGLARRHLPRSGKCRAGCVGAATREVLASCSYGPRRLVTRLHTWPERSTGGLNKANKCDEQSRQLKRRGLLQARVVEASKPRWGASLGERPRRPATDKGKSFEMTDKDEGYCRESDDASGRACCVRAESHRI